MCLNVYVNTLGNASALWALCVPWAFILQGKQYTNKHITPMWRVTEANSTLLLLSFVSPTFLNDCLIVLNHVCFSVSQHPVVITHTQQTQQHWVYNVTATTSEEPTVKYIHSQVKCEYIYKHIYWNLVHYLKTVAQEVLNVSRLDFYLPFNVSDSYSFFMQKIKNAVSANHYWIGIYFCKKKYRKK